MESDIITEPLTAGGWCAPVQPLYDFFPVESPVLDLFPKVQVNRGGIEYKTSVFKEPVSKNDRFLTMAMGVATTSKCRFKHGALVVKHGHILGSSPNIEKNNPRYVDYKHSSVHAEIAAMRKAGWPRKVSLYVARVNKLGESRLSRPCANCQTVLDEYKVKVFWTES